MGLAPARGRFTNLSSSLGSGRRLSGTVNHATRAALVVTEVARAMMLLVSAGLLGRSLVRLLGVNVGFDTSHLLTMEINSTGTRYASDSSVFDFHDRVREAVSALPGVVSVAVSSQLPLGGNLDMYGVADLDNLPANLEQVPYGDRYTVSTDYLSTMRIPIIMGRGFTASEAAEESNKVALVSDALAKRLWPNESPLGKRIRVGGASGPARTVVGVTGNIRHSGLDAKTTLQWYVPERQFGADNQEVLIVRTAGDPAALATTVRRTIAAIDPTQPIVKIATMEDVVAASTSQRRLALVLFGTFAAAALLLAIAGIYGVLAGTVSERTREIGVRSALGATPGRLIGLIMGQGGRLAAVGIVLGLAGSFALTRYLQSLLFGVAPNDLMTLVGVCLLLGAVTLAACLVPAARAARVDPSAALRSE
jgi:putative ABC transport system permease protein